MKREQHPQRRPLIEVDSRLTEVGQGYQVGMQANGHFQRTDGTWQFDLGSVSNTASRYHYQKVSFFGPGSRISGFYSPLQTDPSWFIGSFQQPLVADTLHKTYDENPQLAGNLSFLLGGLVRDQMMRGDNLRGTRGLPEKVEFTTQMTKLAQEGSREAVASAVSMYVLSGGSTERSKEFDGNIYHMAEAITHDPIDIKQTRDLGLSQVARLRSFLSRLSGENDSFPDVQDELKAFDGFPTVGAEFHFSPQAAEEIPDLWRRLTILNLSQYHTESAIQLSRDDQGVIEVRMNPSVYPVTIANWNHMRLLLPELNHTSFTITLNRNSVEGDFTWANKADEKMLKALHGLALLNHVRYFDEEPGNSLPGEIKFGSSYLGQTVSVSNGEFDYRGQWNGGKGKNGQFGIFAGIGDNLPDMAYYLSMFLHDPSLANQQYGSDLRFVRRLYDAYGIGEHWRKAIFGGIDEDISQKSDLSNVRANGNSIMAKLNP